jgi:orotidine-5'-phosphate decarboxylase
VKKNAEIIVPLDMQDLNQASETVNRLRGIINYFKIGKELFTAHGPRAVKAVQDHGAKIFLDLKFHDIPNTVAGASVSAVRMGVQMFNMHASGGKLMMETAHDRVIRECEKSSLPKPIMLGVTVLTSIDDTILREEVRVFSNAADQVVHLARLCQTAGLDGVVCSPREIELVNEACGRDFITVTPGIRPLWAAKGDQKRITTPSQAVKLGADYLVIGRPITGADDPKKAAQRIIDEIQKAAS